MAASKMPEQQTDAAKIYRVTITTDRGAIVMDLDPQLAPNTVNNFVGLARQGYYDGLTFHRVVPEFVIQGGCPEGTGRGGPGYKFADEPVQGEYRSARSRWRTPGRTRTARSSSSASTTASASSRRTTTSSATSSRASTSRRPPGRRQDQQGRDRRARPVPVRTQLRSAGGGVDESVALADRAEDRAEEHRVDERRR